MHTNIINKIYNKFIKPGQPLDINDISYLDEDEIFDGVFALIKENINVVDFATVLSIYREHDQELLINANDETVYAFFNYLLKTNFYSIDQITNKYLVNLSIIRKKEIINIYKNIIKTLEPNTILTPFYETGVSITNSLVLMLLELNRFDLITNLETSTITLTKSTQELLLTKWPKDKYLPHALIGNQPFVEENLSKFSFYTLLMQLTKYNLTRDNIDPLLNIIENRINNNSPLGNPLNISNIFNRFKDKYKSAFPKDLYNKLINYLLNNGVVITGLIEQQSLKSLTNFCNLLNNHLPIDRDLNGIVETSLTKEEISILIKNGLAYKLLDSKIEIQKQYQDEIIKSIPNINKGDTHYSDLYAETIVETPRIATSLVKEGITKQIHLNLYTDNQDYLLEKLDEYLTINKDIKLVSFTIPPKGIINVLLKHKSYKNLLDHGLEFQTIGPNDTDITTTIFDYIDDETLINILKDNYAMAINILDTPSTRIELFKRPNILDTYLLEPNKTKKLIDCIAHHEELSDYITENLYNKLKPFFNTYLGIDINKLNKIKELIGPSIITKLDNENIKELLNCSIEELNKINKLFESRTYTIEDLEPDYDSIKQYEFAKNNPSIIQVFSNIMHAIDDKNYDTLEVCIRLIKPYITTKVLDNLCSNRNIPTMPLKDIVDNILNGIDVELYTNLLHDITNYYITHKREEYRTTYDMKEELKLPYKLDPNSLNKELVTGVLALANTLETNIIKESKLPKPTTIKEFIERRKKKQVTEPLYHSLLDYIYSKVKDDMSYELFIKVVKFKTQGLKLNDTDLNIVKPNIKKVLDATREVLKESPDITNLYPEVLESITLCLDKKGLIKRKYYCESGTCNIEALTSMSIKPFLDKVIRDNDVYNSLLHLMEQKKILNLPECLIDLLHSKRIDVLESKDNMFQFISYYGGIYERNLKHNKKQMSITEIIKEADVYSGFSEIYEIALSSEDAKLIKLNPGPNSAYRKTSNNERLNEAVELTPKLFKRSTIPVPPLVKDYKVGNKKITGIVGNFTSPCNLTHGERTGACMRIGGVGETLFNFALTDPHGFHIRFEDPFTHEYASRVTAFRNGNTVFLNELRLPTSETYTTEDIIDACKQVAEDIIESTSNSKVPVDNVFVYRAYATSEMPYDLQYHFGVNIKEGIGMPFYSDIRNEGIVLASRAKKGIVPIKVNTPLPFYPPARTIPVKETNIVKVTNKINRLNFIKEALKGSDPNYYEKIFLEDGLIVAYIGDDWYIYVDEFGKIHEDVITLDFRAQQELEEYKSLLGEFINSNDKKNNSSYGL